MKKIYLIKSLAPWMMDELLAFSEYSKYAIVFLRQQIDFYDDGIAKLKSKGIEIHTKPFRFNFIFKKVYFMFVFFFKNSSKFVGGYNTAISVKSMFWFLKLNLDIFQGSVNIHSQFATQATILALMLKEFNGENLNYSFTFHAHDIYFKNKWFSKLVNNSENAFSISNYNINYISRTYKETELIRVKLSRLGVLKPEKTITRKENNKFFRIGLISWFIEKKGIKYLLDALKQLKNENVKLILAGDGPLKEEILSYVEINNLYDCFEYIGRIKGKAKKEFFESLDTFVLPAIQIPNDMDGIPVVLMEAISYGLPLITTRVSGIPEICNNEYNGFLIEEKNTKELIEAIIKIKNDKKLKEKFSKNSVKYSKEYDIKLNSKNKLEMLRW